jgi:hypothetical protein
MIILLFINLSILFSFDNTFTNTLDSIIEYNNYNFIDKYLIDNDTLYFEVNNDKQLFYKNNDTILSFEYKNINDDLINSVLNVSNNLIFLKTLDRNLRKTIFKVYDFNGNMIYHLKNLGRVLFKNNKVFLVQLENNKFNLFSFDYNNYNIDTLILNSDKNIYFITNAPENTNFYTQYFSKDSSFILKINNDIIDTIFKSNKHCYSYIIFNDILAIESDTEEANFKIYNNDSIYNFTKNINDDIISFVKINSKFISILTTDFKNKYLRFFKNSDLTTFFKKFENNINLKLPLFIKINDVEINDSLIYLDVSGFFNHYTTIYNIKNKSFSDSSLFFEDNFVIDINGIPCFYIPSKNINSNNILIEAYSNDRIFYFPYTLGKIDSVLLEETDFCFPLFKGSIEVGFKNYLNGLKNGKLTTKNEYVNLIKNLKYLKNDKNVYLYGDSYGALLALCVSLDIPELIQSVYLNAPGINLLNYLNKHFDQKNNFPFNYNLLKQLSPFHILKENNNENLPVLNLVSYYYDEITDIEEHIEFYKLYSTFNKHSSHTILYELGHKTFTNSYYKKIINRAIYQKMYNEMLLNNK